MERLGAERLAVVLSLAGVVGLAWLYLWREAAALHSAMAMDMPGMTPMDGIGVGLTLVMWLVMMAGMMLPSAAPMVLLYGAMVRRNAQHGSVLPTVWIFVGGYLLVWAGFSLCAAFLQALLQHAALVSPMMVASSKGLTALLLAAAGVYQLTPLKQRCLRHCREPVQFLMTHWRPGRAGALRMGLEHGAYCLGCCWMLMLLLFAVGVMNLAWVAALAAFVFVEKLLPAGRFTSRFAGAALLALGAATLL